MSLPLQCECDEWPCLGAQPIIHFVTPEPEDLLLRAYAPMHHMLPQQRFFQAGSLGGTSNRLVATHFIFYKLGVAGDVEPDVSGTRLFISGAFHSDAFCCLVVPGQETRRWQES